MDNEIMIYEDKDGITKVNVKFIEDDIWLTQNQISDIYKTTQENISIHITNIYKDNELNWDSTNKKFLLVQKEGTRNLKDIEKNKNGIAPVAINWDNPTYGKPLANLYK